MIKPFQRKIDFDINRYKNGVWLIGWGMWREWQNGKRKWTWLSFCFRSNDKQIKAPFIKLQRCER